MIRVTENLKQVSDLLAISSAAAARDPATVTLLAVSKKQPLDAILEAAATGQRDFGENFVQEALAKIHETADLDLTWHFIGHLQSNKTRDVAKNFDWVHTIDNLKTARRLAAQRPAELGPINVCLQVNIDAEPGKSGVAPGDVANLAAACSDLPNLLLRGLMCLPAVRSAADDQQEPFRRLRILFETLQQEHVNLDTLSMGMSGDYAAAIAEGATIVRIGTAVFGERQQ